MHVFLPPLRTRHAVPVATLAGALLWLAFPPYGWWPLAFAGVALLSVATAGRSGRSAFGVGLVAGFAFFLPLLDWLTNVGLHAWLVLAISQALATGLLGLALALTSRLSWWPLAQAGVWVGYEGARGRYPLGGFTWGRLAFSQSRSPLVPLAALGGAPLVTFATALIGLALLWLALTVRRDGVRRPLAFAPGLAVLIVVALGSVAVPVPSGSNQHLTVAAVQGNVPALGLERSTEELVVVSNHAAATAALALKVAAGSAPRPGLVIWPESSTDIDPRRDEQVRSIVLDASSAIRAPILIGAALDTDDGQILNAGLVWDPDSGPGQVYVKQHLVPFGEYVPLRGLLGKRIRMLDQYIPRNFAPGNGPAVLDIAGVRVGDVICFEVAYDGLVRNSVRAGAQLLVVQTNNATYMRGRDPAQTEQQLEMGRLRAVEHGRAVVVAATSGISALIAPDGTTLARSGVFTQEELVAALPVRSTLTVADRLGAWPELLLCLLGVVAIGIAARGRNSPVERWSDDDSAPPPDGQRIDHAERRRAIAALQPGKGYMTQNDPSRVLVVIPTYNEADNIRIIVSRLRAAVPDADALIVDDSSPDGTGAIADELAAADDAVNVLHRDTKTGLGAAYVAGFAWAAQGGYGVVVEMDADGSHQPEELPKLLAALADADVVLGSRWVEGGAVRNWPVSRKILSKGGNRYTRIALGLPLQDATGGYRAYRRAVLDELPLDAVSSQGYCFQVDLVWQAWRRGFRVVEVPIT
ncbi:MAG: apolipoprotein N-acyltransferase, partial [Actinomycetota bacterium]